QVVEANLKFYFALESLDIDLMDEVWATDASAICIHPNSERLAGWENIRNSWEQIFRNTTFMRIDVSEVSVEVQGQTAWVTCLESITTSNGDQMRRAHAYATNIFVFEDDRWLLVLHHASLGHGAQETT
ncbi:MAG TPA: nuclear transport factor 2 family protein, partial [Terriglobia bacterium]|nr:nuclear transport factor 2 family protein [Terriglobia bacterium]